MRTTIFFKLNILVSLGIINNEIDSHILVFSKTFVLIKKNLMTQFSDKRGKE